MQAQFLLGPAGSGKTYCCLAEIREELKRSPEGPPLILLVPKQATFQLERQLLGCGEYPCEPSTNFAGPPGVSSNQMFGYTRLHILSFERLAQFVFDQLRVPQPEALSEEGRVMVLRALLMQWQSKLKIFRVAARLNGFAQQLSLLLREFQRHHLSPSRLDKLAANPDLTPHLRDKLHDLALLLRAYADWLKSHRLRDVNDLLDSAGESLRTPHSAFRVSALWLDGFAEMTPQELELLATVLPFCERATLAFCVESEPQADPSWLSTWSVVGQTFRRCHARLKTVEDCEVKVEELVRESNRGRFATNEVLQNLEASWSVGTRSTVSQTSIPKKNGDAVERIPAKFSFAVRLVTCADPEAETTLAAREILQFVRTGGRYRDCAVIVRDLEPYHATLSRVFRRYQLPFFMDRREPVAHHPLAELTRSAFRTVTFGWRHDDWFGALKSGLVPTREEEIDELENEALARGWEGKVWLVPLSRRTESASLDRLENLRRQLVPPFENLTAALAPNQSGGPTGIQVAAALRQFWETLNVEATLEKWSTAAKENLTPDTPHLALHSTVLVQMHDWLDNLALAFPTVSLPLREWVPILEAGLTNLTVGVIPPMLDQVLIGAVDRSRNPDLKLAIVLGLNEGVFPAAPVPSVLLTDAERAALPPDVFLGPTNHQRIGHERYLAYIACTRARQRLVLTRALRDADGQPLNPSPFFEHVKQLTGATEESFVSPAPWRQSEHVCELTAPVLRMCAGAEGKSVSGKPAPDLSEDGIIATSATRMQFPSSEGSGVGSLATLPALAPLVAKWHQIQVAAHTEKLPPTTTEKLFGHELASSVSGLEDFAACPFKFFAARGLRLEERKEFQFDDRDKGSFQHEVLREFHRRVRATGRLWRHLNAPEAIIIVNDIARNSLSEFEGGKLLADGAARFTSEVLIERLEQLVGVLVEWMAQYEFDPTRVELGFGLGAPEDMPAWRLELPEAHALLLRGRIDRVDLCHLDEETALAVVMDYKSRTRKLHPVKLHHGLELQLLSYLGVLRHLSDPKTFFGVQKLLPAGVFYVPLNGGGSRTAGSRADALATSIQDQRTAYQHNGRFIADELEHFDNRGELKGDQFRFAKNKDGRLSARGNDALSKSEFEALREKIEGHLRDYASRIFAGEVAVSPFRVGNQTACDYCDFRAVCRFDPWTQPFRVLRPPPKPAKETSVRKRKTVRVKK